MNLRFSAPYSLVLTLSVIAAAIDTFKYIKNYYILSSILLLLLLFLLYTTKLPSATKLYSKQLRSSRLTNTYGDFSTEAFDM